MPTTTPMLPAELERLATDPSERIVDLLAMPDAADIEFEPARLGAICQPVEFE